MSGELTGKTTGKRMAVEEDTSQEDGVENGRKDDAVSGSKATDGEYVTGDVRRRSSDTLTSAGESGQQTSDGE